MKSFKVAFISFLLSLSTLGVLYTQTAPKLAFSINSGITSSGLPIQFGVRGKLTPHLAINGQIGNAPWRWKEKTDRQIMTNVTLKNLKIRGQFSIASDLRAYTKPGHTGFYGGLGFMRQQIKMETKTKLRSSRSGTSLVASAKTFAGFLIGGFFDILTNSARNTTVERLDKATINAFTLDGGYAHFLKNNSRIEFGLRFINRKINHVQYFVPTFDEPKAFDLDKIAKPLEVTAEIRYIATIF